MKLNKILFLIGVIGFLVDMSAVSVMAEDQPAKKIEVQFEYTGSATSYRLYMDGAKVCETAASTEKKMMCDNITINYGVHMFTMTAIESSGIESNHSPAYAWTYSPVNGAPPTFINFSITVDGKTIPVGPLGLTN